MIQPILIVVFYDGNIKSILHCDITSIYCKNPPDIELISNFTNLNYLSTTAPVDTLLSKVESNLEILFVDIKNFVEIRKLFKKFVNLKIILNRSGKTKIQKIPYIDDFLVFTESF